MWDNYVYYWRKVVKSFRFFSIQFYAIVFIIDKEESNLHINPLLNTFYLTLLTYLDKKEKAIIAEQWRLRKELLKNKGQVLPGFFLTADADLKDAMEKVEKFRTNLAGGK